MASDYVTTSPLGRGRVLKIHRPRRRNALGSAVCAALRQQIDTVQEDLQKNQPIDWVIITAAALDSGPRRIWIGGGDLKELAHMDQRAAADYAARWNALFTQIANLPVLVCSLVDGEAIGGGAELAISCDLCFATPRASFHWKQLQAGLPLGYGTTARLAGLIGAARLRQLLFLPRLISAQEAYDIGLVQRLVSSGDPAETADLFTTLAPAAVAAQKAMLARALPAQFEATQFSKAWGNPTHRSLLTNYAKDTP